MNKIFCILVLCFSLPISGSVAHASETKKKCKGNSEASEIIKCIKKVDPTVQKPITDDGKGGVGGNIHPSQFSTYSQ